MQIKLKDGKPVYKAEWVVVGDKRIFVRSRWEFYYAIFLQQLKQQGQIIDWEYEKKTFWFDKIKRGVRSYKPDFEVFHLNGTSELVEVKGYMDDRSKTKITRMRIYYPKINLRIVTREWFIKKGFDV